MNWINVGSIVLFAGGVVYGLWCISNFRSLFSYNRKKHKLLGPSLTQNTDTQFNKKGKILDCSALFRDLSFNSITCLAFNPHDAKVFSGKHRFIYVCDQLGVVYCVDMYAEKPHLMECYNIQSLIRELENPALTPGNMDERGLMSIAFSPEYRSPSLYGYNKVYISFIAKRPVIQESLINIGTQSLFVVECNQYTDNGLWPKMEFSKIILQIPQENNYHHGGTLQFAPDGTLFIALGDGGPQMDPNLNAQNLHTLKGKILRINVRNTPSLYTIPQNNPLWNSNENPNQYRAEIWASGLRNPWKFDIFSLPEINNNHSFPYFVIVGDVGHQTKESVKLFQAHPPKGLPWNGGWNITEGTYVHDTQQFHHIKDAPNYKKPVFEYFTEKNRRAMIGGVYLPFQQLYICGDYMSSEIFVLEGTPGKEYWKLQKTINVSTYVRKKVHIHSFLYDPMNDPTQIFIAVSEDTHPFARSSILCLRII